MAEKNLRLRVLLDLADKALAPLKRISQGSKETAASLKAAREQLKQLNAQQSALGNFAKHTQTLREAGNQLQVLKQQLQAMQAAGVASAAQMQKQQAAIDKQTAKYREQQATVFKLRNALNSMGVTSASQAQQRIGADIAATTAKINAQTEALKRQSAEQRKLADIQRQAKKSAAIGGAMTATGTGMAYGANRAGHAMAPLMNQSRHAETEAVRIRALGLGQEESTKAIDYAKNFKSYGTSQLDNMELMRDAVTVFNDRHHAEEAMPILADMKFANEAVFGSAEGGDNARKFMDMMKVIEMRGGANNKADFERNANMIQQVITATGGRVGANDWMHVIQRGKLAAKGFDEKEFFYRLEPLVQEMGGDAVGTGLTAAYQNLYQGRTTKRAAQNLDKFGLIGDYSKVKHDKVGQTAQLNPGALKGADIFRRSQFEWMEKVLIPALRAKGIESEQATIDAIGSIFSNTNAGALMATMYQQRAMVQKGYELNSKADNIQQLKERAVNMPSGQEVNLRKRYDDLKKSIGDTAMPAYTKVLDVLAKMTESTQRFVERHPGLTKALVYSAAVLTAFAAVCGLLLIPLGLLIAKSMLLRFALARIGISAGPLSLLRGLFRGAATGASGLLSVLARLGGALVSGVGTAMRFLLVWGGRGLGLLARFAPMLLRLLGPFGLLATAGWMVYQNWEGIVGGAKLLWADLTNALTNLWGSVVNTGIALWQGFSGVLGGLWAGLVTFYQSALQQIAAVSDAVWQGIINGATGLWQGFIATLAGIWLTIQTTASAAWTGMSAQFAQFGGWIIDGLIGGITGKLGQLRDTVVGAASSAAQWFREKLGINSPSRVFTQFGGWISEGAALGIEGGQAAVRAAALAMAASAMVPVANATLQPPAVPSMAAQMEVMPTLGALPGQLPTATLQANPVLAAVPQLPPMAAKMVAMPTLGALPGQLPAATLQANPVPAAVPQLPPMAAKIAVMPTLGTLPSQLPAATLQANPLPAAVPKLPPMAAQMAVMPSLDALPVGALALPREHQISVRLLGLEQLQGLPQVQGVNLQGQSGDAEPIQAQPVPRIQRGTAIASRPVVAPASAGNSTYDITINPAPGMDPQAIARAVAAELDRREQQAGARRRSRLQDLD